MVELHISVQMIHRFRHPTTHTHTHEPHKQTKCQHHDGTKQKESRRNDYLTCSVSTRTHMTVVTSYLGRKEITVTKILFTHYWNNHLQIRFDCVHSYANKKT